MNREEYVLTVLLDVAAEWGHQIDDAVLHAQMNNRVIPPASLAEFIHARTTALNEGFISRLEKTRKNLLTITYKGEAERLK